MRLQVRISPGAPRTKILGWHGDRLKIAIAAPPEDGKANAGLIRFLSETLKIDRQEVRILTGLTSKDKTVELPEGSQDRLNENQQ